MPYLRIKILRLLSIEKLKIADAVICVGSIEAIVKLAQFTKFQKFGGLPL